MMSIGEKSKQERAANNLTQEGLAEKIGVTTGRRTPILPAYLP